MAWLASSLTLTKFLYLKRGPRPTLAGKPRVVCHLGAGCLFVLFSACGMFLRLPTFLFVLILILNPSVDVL